MAAKPLPRRTVLRAASAAIGLPFLEAMTPRPAAGAAAPAIRPRAAFFFVPNGSLRARRTGSRQPAAACSTP